MDEVFADPGAGWQIAIEMADDLAIAEDGRAGWEIGQGDFVGLGDGVAERQTVGEDGAPGEAAGVGDDGDVIARIDFDK